MVKTIFKIFLSIFLCLTFSGIPATWANTPVTIPEKISVSISENDSLSTDNYSQTLIISEPPQGRFNRGIFNYLFIPKKQWFIGLSASLGQFNSKDSQLLIFFKEFDCHGYSMSINPFIAYCFKNNNCLGVKFGIGRSQGVLDNITMDLGEDLNFTIKDMLLESESLSTVFFHRGYVGLSTNKRFALFNETFLSINSGTSRFKRGSEESLNDAKTTFSEIQLGLNPGFCVFIMNNISTEVSFGVLGLKYRKEKQQDNNGETGSYHTNGANFKINIFNISFGMTIHI